jgi:hypothetical protein
MVHIAEQEVTDSNAFDLMEHNINPGVAADLPAIQLVNDTVIPRDPTAVVGHVSG